MLVYQMANAETLDGPAAVWLRCNKCSRFSDSLAVQNREPKSNARVLLNMNVGWSSHNSFTGNDVHACDLCNVEPKGAKAPIGKSPQSVVVFSDPRRRDQTTSKNALLIAFEEITGIDST
ncbi:MAG TPA: hypothetical protein VKA67_01860, partial [Verrucomicrobiae bacterium]|nr:hypothetical protein [Verrucomicrobiae bacterium]